MPSTTDTYITMKLLVVGLLKNSFSKKSYCGAGVKVGGGVFVGGRMGLGVGGTVAVGVGGNGVLVKVGVTVGVGVSVAVAVAVGVIVGVGVLLAVGVAVKVGSGAYVRSGVASASLKEVRNWSTSSAITPAGVGVGVGRRERLTGVSPRSVLEKGPKSRSMVGDGVAAGSVAPGMAALASSVGSLGTGAGEAADAAWFWALPAAGISTTAGEPGMETLASTGELSAGTDWV